VDFFGTKTIIVAIRLEKSHIAITKDVIILLLNCTFKINTINKIAISQPVKIAHHPLIMREAINPETSIKRKNIVKTMILSLMKMKGINILHLKSFFCKYFYLSNKN
jgi:hypothetical protein